MAHRFEDKVVLITGAAQGIGFATARLFAAEGARVVIADRNAAGAKEAAAQIDPSGERSLGVEVDVADYSACVAMVERTVERFGRLDIAFNNAGIPGHGGAAIAEVDVGAWAGVIDVNVNGVFHCIKAEVPAMRRNPGGVIINTASSASFEAVPNLSAYIASKHAVAGITKAAALDLIGEGIRVNAVCPGMTLTPMMQPLMDDPEMEAMFQSLSPIKRLAAPEEIAAGVLFLASDEASYAVGTLLRIDGGLTLS